MRRATGDMTERGLVWSYPLDGHCCSTPAIHEGLVYVADCGGKVHCVDARSGQPYWVHDAGGEIWASTLVADGKVYIGTRRGRVLGARHGDRKAGPQLAAARRSRHQHLRGGQRHALRRHDDAAVCPASRGFPPEPIQVAWDSVPSKSGQHSKPVGTESPTYEERRIQ